MLNRKLKGYIDCQFSSGVETGEDYKAFERVMRTDLRKQAKENNLMLKQFNRNHYCFSAVLQDEETENYVYVSISDVRFMKNEWVEKVLIRNMKHEKDWTGEANNYCEWENVGTKARELATQKGILKEVA